MARRVNLIDTDGGIWLHQPKGVSVTTVIGVIMILAIGFVVYTYLTHQQAVNGKSEIESCVESYEGRDLSFYDWATARKLSNEQIRQDIGVNDNVIRDCFGRW